MTRRTAAAPSRPVTTTSRSVDTFALSLSEDLRSVQRPATRADTRNVNRDVAPVVAAEVLLRHGLADDRIVEYLARTWALDEIDCVSAVAAARVLIRREHPHEIGSDL